MHGLLMDFFKKTNERIVFVVIEILEEIRFEQRALDVEVTTLLRAVWLEN